MSASKPLFGRMVTWALLVVSLTVMPLPEVYANTSSVDRVVYFTFDDGPSETYTPIVLDILKKEDVKATFFLVGSRCNSKPQLVRRIVSEGHEVGNHGYTHHYIKNAAPAVVRSEVQQTDEAIVKACGMKPVYFRPPGGFFNIGEANELHSLGHRTVLWTVDSHDWNATAVGPVVDNVVNYVKPGSVVLFHDGITTSKYTVQALPLIISNLKQRGYHFDILPVTRKTVFKVF